MQYLSESPDETCLPDTSVADEDYLKQELIVFHVFNWTPIHLSIDSMINGLQLKW